MAFSSEQIRIFQLIRDHGNYTAYELESELGPACLPTLWALAEDGTVEVGLEYEDRSACALSLGPDALSALAQAEHRPIRRKDRQLDRAAALDILDRCVYAVLATVGPDGSPYCVPLSIARDGINLYFHSALEGQKAEYLRANPSVCLTAVGDVQPAKQKFTTGYESAVVYGTAQEITDEAEKIAALRLLCLRHVPAHMDCFEEEVSRSLGRTGVWRIQIDHVTAKAKRLKNE